MMKTQPISESLLLDLISVAVYQWVDEEMEANGDIVSREQRLEETRSTFLEALTESWGLV